MKSVFSPQTPVVVQTIDYAHAHKHTVLWVQCRADEQIKKWWFPIDESESAGASIFWNNWNITSTCVMHLEVDYITKHLKYQQGALGQMPG